MTDDPSLPVRPRVLLADDHVIMAEALRSLLCDRCEIVGIVPDGRSLVAEATRLKPDLIVLDIGMPHINGIQAAQQIQKVMPEMRFIFLTIMEYPHTLAAALRLGPIGYVLKQSAASDLMDAIQQVLSGRPYVTTRIDHKIPSIGREQAQQISKRMSPGQRDVLKLLAEGRLMKEIADVLQISVKTVEYRKYQVMKSFQLQSSAEVVLFALENGIVSPPVNPKTIDSVGKTANT